LSQSHKGTMVRGRIKSEDSTKNHRVFQDSERTKWEGTRTETGYSPEGGGGEGEKSQESSLGGVVFKVVQVLCRSPENKK